MSVCYMILVFNEGATGCDSHIGSESVLCAGYPEVDCVNDVCVANPSVKPTTGIISLSSFDFQYY